jgi:peptide/nickel transport system substrate-binding protein
MNTCVKNTAKSVAYLLAVTASAALGAAPKQGGTLTVPIITQTFVEDFNPYSGSQGDIVTGTMFEPLWVLNTMRGEVDWRLAKSFEYGTDLRSMTITLKDGLTWSDGQVLDAEDLVFSLNLGKSDAKLDVTGQWGDGVFESVEMVDNRRVRLNFSVKDGTVDWHLPRLHVVPEHIWKDVEEKSTFPNPNPVGSGPITEVRQVKDNQIEVCRNPNYYKADQGLPYLDCIKFRQYTDNSQIQAALINNEIDWGSNFISDIEKTYVAPDPDNHGYWYPANDLIHLYLNTRKLPFSDVRFRQAVSMALDRPMIVDLAAYGYPTPETHVTGIGEFFKTYHNEELNQKYDYLAEYNPEEASRLLDEAGFKDIDGDGFLENPDGSPIDFEIQVVNGWTDWVQTVQMVSEYLAEVGIRATTRTVDWSVYDSALKEGTYDVSINWSRTNGEDPIQAYRDYFYTTQRGRSWHTNHGVGSESVDRLIDEYVATDDERRRKQILSELMEFTAENLAFVPLFSNPTWYQYNRTRIDGWPTEQDPYVQPVFYNPGTKLLVFERLFAK